MIDVFINRLLENEGWTEDTHTRSTKYRVFKWVNSNNRIYIGKKGAVRKYDAKIKQNYSIGSVRSINPFKLDLVMRDS